MPGIYQETQILIMIIAEHRLMHFPVVNGSKRVPKEHKKLRAQSRISPEMPQARGPNPCNWMEGCASNGVESEWGEFIRERIE